MDSSEFAHLGGIKGIGGEALRPMSESELSLIEDELGVPLPEDYRSFLATYGGSTFCGRSPDSPFILIRPLQQLPQNFSSGQVMVDALYGCKRRDHDGYSLSVRIRFFAGRMPESIIPIGDDGGWGQICLGIRGKESGKVYYWYQADEPLDEETYLEDYGHQRPPEAMFQNVYQIAESFTDFLERLEPMTD